MAASSAASNNKSRKVKALLAGGLVLGVGAAVTLAAWTDQEWVKGEFTAGSFNIQGSTNGTDFSDHASADGAAQLGFDLPANLSANLAPGDTVAAPFSLRLAAGTTYDAAVKLKSAAGTGDNAGNLTYKLVQVADAASCTPEAAGTTTLVAEGTSLNTAPDTAEFALEQGTSNTAGTAVNLCFQVTAGDDLKQGQQATATWLVLG